MVCKCAGDLARILHPHLYDNPIVNLLILIHHKNAEGTKHWGSLACMMGALSMYVEDAYGTLPS